MADGFSGDFAKRFTDLGNDGWEYSGSFSQPQDKTTLIFKPPARHRAREAANKSRTGPFVQGGN